MIIIKHRPQFQYVVCGVFFWVKTNSLKKRHWKSGTTVRVTHKYRTFTGHRALPASLTITRVFCSVPTSARDESRLVKRQHYLSYSTSCRGEEAGGMGHRHFFLMIWRVHYKYRYKVPLRPRGGSGCLFFFFFSLLWILGLPGLYVMSGTLDCTGIPPGNGRLFRQNSYDTDDTDRRNLPQPVSFCCLTFCLFSPLVVSSYDIFPPDFALTDFDRSISHRVNGGCSSGRTDQRTEGETVRLTLYGGGG